MGSGKKIVGSGLVYFFETSAEKKYNFRFFAVNFEGNVGPRIVSTIISCKKNVGSGKKIVGSGLVYLSSVGSGSHISGPRTRTPRPRTQFPQK